MLFTCWRALLAGVEPWTGRSWVITPPDGPPSFDSFLLLPPFPFPCVCRPQAGYGTNAKTRNLLPNGFYKVRVNNVKELEALMMQNKKYCAEIAAAVSARVRKDIVARAEVLNILVVNKDAKLRKEEA